MTEQNEQNKDCMKDAIKRYMSLTDQIKELKDEKKDAEDQILEFMKSNKLEVIQLSNSNVKFRLSTVKRVQVAKKEEIIQIIRNTITNPALGEQIIQTIFDKPVIEKQVLKKTTN